MSTSVEWIAEPAAGVDVAPVVERLAQLRSQAQRRRYSGATPQLPSRQSILDMTDDVLGALYPRHLGGPVLSHDGLDQYVSHALERALPKLGREIALELSLRGQGGGTDPFLNPAEVALQFVEALPGIRETVDLDIRASLAADPAQGSFDELVFCSPGVAAILRHRLAHELQQLGAPLMAKIIAEDCRSKTGIDIHPGAEIGEGFSIANAAGLAIGETAVIGRNVRMHAPVTLGESFSIASGVGEAAHNVVTLASARSAEGGPDRRARRHPRIEDDVVIHAGASLYGPITVGRGSTIGRNVWLVRDVPPLSRIEEANTAD
jgi:serine O-acetyltransferase